MLWEAIQLWKRNNFLSLFALSMMARFAAGRTVLMIWVATGCVVALLVRKKQGKRLGAGWRGHFG